MTTNYNKELYTNVKAKKIKAIRVKEVKIKLR